MNINAILLDEKDNVVTCVREVKAGETVAYLSAEGTGTLCAAEDIPYCHKVALRAMKSGDIVVKYGEMIGRLNQDVALGGLVNEHNLYSVPRDYDSELV